MIRERLITAMAEKNVTQGALAKAIGVTPAAVQQLVNGKTQRTRHLRAIAEFLEVSELWLEGESEDQIDPMGGLLHHVRMMVSNKMSDMTGELMPVKHPIFVDDRLVPFDVREKNEAYILVSDVGDAMSPTISSNDTLLVRYHKQGKSLDQQGAIWIIDDGYQRTLRRLTQLPNGDFQVDTDNPAHPSVRVPAGTFVILAKVVWQTRVLGL